jgi:hypothetical protein
VSGTFIDNGSAAQGTSGHAYAEWTGSPTANATVGITIAMPLASTYTGVFLRGSSGAANHYAGYVAPDGRVHIARRNSYNYTYLADGPAFPSGSHVVSLQASGANPVHLTLAVDGVTVASYNDSSSSALTASGKAGIFDYNGAGQPLDNFWIQ